MHIAFLDANTDRSAFAARHASEVVKFRALMAPVAPQWRFTDFRASEGVLPASLTGFDGIMISGSPASVHDPEAWIARLLALIRSAAAQGVPVFGACFGHQAVAAALGGRVAKNPQGWVLGRVETRNHTPAAWMTRAPPAMTLHAAHNEQVVALPPGAQVLAGTDMVPHGHLALGRRIFTTQYHPEITGEFMAALVDELEATLAAPVIARARHALSGPVDDALMARWIAAFFAQARG